MVLLFILYGLLLGSFFNVLIYRLPEKKSIIFPGSHCPKCNNKIKPWQNIPVLSYILLKGKCSKCGCSISIAYPLTELITALAAAGLWLIIKHTGYPATLVDGAVFIITSLFLLLIIPISVIDFRYYIIPDTLTLPFIIIGFLSSILPGSLTPLQSLLGIVAGGGSLYAIGWIGELIFKKEAMGGGDIKLMAAAGALFGPQCVLLAFLFGACFGAIYGIAIIIMKKLNSSHQIPFGPFLFAGIWVAVFAGKTILNAYLNFIGIVPIQ